MDGAPRRPDGRTAYETAEAYIDLDNVIDAYIIHAFFGDTDWPHNNYRIWRYAGGYDPENPYTDGRWRIALVDMDMAFGNDAAVAGILPQLMGDAGGVSTLNPFAADMMQKLLASEAFRARFMDRLSVCLSSALSPDELRPLLRSMADAVRPLVPEAYARWPGQAHSPKWWEAHVDGMEEFIEARGDAFLAQAEAYMGGYGG